MGCAGSVPSRRDGCVRAFVGAATVAILLMPRPSAAGSITGTSWDGAPPGTLADLSGQSSFSFGLPAFMAGVFDVTWIGGVTAWRGLTTIGADNQILFEPGPVATGTARSITMTDSWTLWADTPDLSHADSTSAQWAFAALDAQTWVWGLEDIAIGRCGVRALYTPGHTVGGTC